MTIDETIEHVRAVHRDDMGHCVDTNHAVRLADEVERLRAIHPRCTHAIASALAYFAPTCARCDNVAVGHDSIRGTATCGDDKCLTVWHCEDCDALWEPHGTDPRDGWCRACPGSTLTEDRATVLDAPWSKAVRWALEVLT